jgi:hypothetical protein
VPSSVAEAAGIAAMVFVAIAVAALVVLHLVPTGLSPMRNAVSHYGITDYRLGYRVATIALGLTGACLVVGLGETLSGSGSGVVLALLAVFAFARLIISWFPMDAPGAQRTETGRAHGLIAIVTFTTITAAALRLGTILSRMSPWHSLAPVTTILGVVMVICIIGMVLCRSTEAIRQGFGLIERGLYLAILGWCAVFGVACAVGIR